MAIFKWPAGSRRRLIAWNGAGSWAAAGRPAPGSDQRRRSSWAGAREQELALELAGGAGGIGIAGLGDSGGAGPAARSWVFARCVEIYADYVGRARLRVVNSQTGEPVEHGLPRLLSRPPGGPNPSMAAQALWRIALSDRITHGGWVWEAAWPGRVGEGEPSALWPLPWDSVTPVRNKPGAPEFQPGVGYFRGYKVGERMMASEQIFRPYRPDPADPTRAQPVLNEAAEAIIALTSLRREWFRAFVENGGAPAAIISYIRSADPAADERMRAQWEARHAGPRNAGKPLWLAYNDPGYDEDGGASVAGMVDVKTVGTGPSEIASIEREARDDMAIAAALGVPWSLLDASGRTFENADAERETWELGPLAGLFAELEDALSTGLLPLFGRSDGLVVRFDRGEKNAAPRFTPYEGIALATAGVITPEEVRREVAGSPVDLLATPAPGVATEEPSADLASGEDDAPAGEDDGGDDADARALALEVVRLRAERLAHARAVRLDVSARSLGSELRLVDRGMQAIFDRQLQGALTGLRAERAEGEDEPPWRGSAGDVFDAAEWTATTAAAAAVVWLPGVVRSVGVTFAAAGVADAVSGDMDSVIRGFVLERANRLAGEVTSTTYDAIKKQIAAGIDAGEGITAISRRIQSVFAASSMRARRIARTEVIGAYNQAAELVGRTSSNIALKEWVVAADGRERESHAAAGGQRVDSDADFAVGGVRMNGPGDPSAPASEIVNCRCTLVFYTAAEAEEMRALRALGCGDAIIRGIAGESEERCGE